MKGMIVVPVVVAAVAQKAEKKVSSGSVFKPRAVSREEFDKNWDITFGPSGKAN